MANGDRRRLSREERESESERIYELREKGVSIAGLADRFGYSKSQIINALYKYRKRLKHGSQKIH